MGFRHTRNLNRYRRRRKLTDENPDNDAENDEKKENRTKHKNTIFLITESKRLASTLADLTRTQEIGLLYEKIYI